MTDRPLSGRVALVTGGSRGIGAASARALAAAGAAVGVNYRSSPDEADEVVDAIGKAGGRALAIKGDVADEKAVDHMFDALRSEYGDVDIVFSNAGIQKDAPFADLSLDDWNAVIGANLTGAFLVAREAVRGMLARPRRGREARGTILFNSSVHEIIPWAGHANYAASKGGIAMLMRSLAQEVSHEGIRVNAVAPGAIRTDINRDELSEETLDLIPYKRIGDTEDIARAVVWLASDASDYVVGHTLVVDGGMTLYPGFRDNG